MDANILISCSNDLTWRTSYEEAVAQAGGAFVSHHLPAVDTGYDGLLLCGGGDIEPMRYGQENCGSTDIAPQRDEAELALIHAYLHAKKPILAVCRGHQLINVALGGTLIQDLPATQAPFHTRAPGTTEDRVHHVCATEGSVLHALYGSLFSVNSYHHQAVDALGRDLCITARSEAGVVEAMEHSHLPILCLQFHPERMTGKHRRPDTVDGGAIFDWLIARCKEVPHG